MATTSSNKMPLLVDRPLHSFASLGASAGLTTASNFNTPNANLTLLVDCSTNDGAIIDSISLVSNEASLTSVKVIAFLSVATSGAGVTAINTLAVANATVGSSLGDRVNMSLPALSVPVPNLASPAATAAAYPRKPTRRTLESTFLQERLCLLVPALQLQHLLPLAGSTYLLKEGSSNGF